MILSNKRGSLLMALTSLSLLCAPCALASSQTGAASIVRSDNGKPVAASHINKAVIESGLVARLEPGSSLQLYDVRVTAKVPSAVMLSASSEFLTVAVLKGTIESGKISADAGQLIVWPMDSKTPQRYSYDIGRLLASSSPAIDESLRADMEPVLKQQQRALYWGKLQPANTNVRAPLSPALETVRRKYVFSPSTVEARRAAVGDQAVASRDVADKFLSALAGRDSETVAELLDPTLFHAKGSSAGWMESRAHFARKLTGSSLPGKLKHYTLEKGEKNSWTVLAGGKTYVLEQAGNGTFPFVKKLEAE